MPDAALQGFRQWCRAVAAIGLHAEAAAIRMQQDGYLLEIDEAAHQRRERLVDRFLGAEDQQRFGSGVCAAQE